MKKRSASLALATVVGALATFTVGVSAAHAEVTEDAAAAIVDASLENLASDPVSDALSAELADGVIAADEAGLVDQEIIDAVTEVIDAEPAPADPETVIESPIIDDLLNERLDGDQELWDEIAPAWMEAFETIRADFEACRTEGESTSECARTLGFSLQVAHAQVVLADIDARVANLAELPEEEQIAALAELEAERAAVEARLARAEEKLLASPASARTVRAENVTEVLAQVRERASVTTGADRAALATQGGASQGGATQGGAGQGAGTTSGANSGNANSGNSNSGGGNAGAGTQQVNPGASSTQQPSGQTKEPAERGKSDTSNGKQGNGRQ